MFKTRSPKIALRLASKSARSAAGVAAFSGNPRDHLVALAPFDRPSRAQPRLRPLGVPKLTHIY
jgi:hypothetical protein